MSSASRATASLRNLRAATISGSDPRGTWTKLMVDLLPAEPFGGPAYPGTEFHQLFFDSVGGYWYIATETGNPGVADYVLCLFYGTSATGPYASWPYQNAILAGTGGGSDWDGFWVATPCIVKIAGVWRLFYCASSVTSAGANWSFGMADFPLAVDLVEDHFTASNGTALTSHTPDKDAVGGGWGAVAGTYQIQSNAATPNSDANDDQAVIDAGQANVLIAAALTPRAGSGWEDSPGFVIRGSNSTHLWIVVASAAVGTAHLTLYENAGGGYAQQGNVGGLLATGVTNTIKVEANGPVISVYAEGEFQYSYTSATSNQTVTKHGLRIGVGGSVGTLATWDDLYILGAGSLLSQADGASTAGFAGVTAAVGALSATGSSTASFTAPASGSAWSATGSSTASFTGASLAAAVWASTGTSTTAFTGQSLAAGVWSAAGSSTAAFTGASLVSAVWAATGSDVTTFAAPNLAAAEWDATGTSTAAFFSPTTARPRVLSLIGYDGSSVTLVGV